MTQPDLKLYNNILKLKEERKMELKEILTLPHGLCSVCVKRSYCDMVEDMAFDGWDMVYKEECQWFKRSKQ